MPHRTSQSTFASAIQYGSSWGADMLNKPHVIYAADMSAIFTIIASSAGWLPAIATLLAIVVYSLQIFTWFKNQK